MRLPLAMVAAGEHWGSIGAWRTVFFGCGKCSKRNAVDNSDFVESGLDPMLFPAVCFISRRRPQLAPERHMDERYVAGPRRTNVQICTVLMMPCYPRQLWKLLFCDGK
jgi:hypothetical protein